MPPRKTDTPQDQGSTQPTQPTRPSPDDISGAVNRAIAAILGISPNTSSLGVFSGHPNTQPQIGVASTVKGSAAPAAAQSTDPLSSLLTPQLSPNQRLSSTLDLLGLLQRQAEATAAAQATPAQPSIASLLGSIVPAGQVYNSGFEPGGLADTLSNLISGGHGSTIQDSSRMVNRVPVQSLIGTPEQKVAPAPLDIQGAVNLMNLLAPQAGAATTQDTSLPTIQGLTGHASGGVESAHGGGTMLHVGEGKKSPSDEYVYLPPGSQAVVAPRKKGEPASMQNAMVSVAKQVAKKGKLRKAAAGGVYADSAGNPLQAAGGDYAGLLQLLISGYRAADQNQSILDFSNQLGLTNPAAYGETNPAVIRGLLGQGTPTLAARQLQANIANQSLQAQLAREQLASQMGLNQQELGLKSQELGQNAMMNQQDLALKRELGEGQLALGNRQADLQARQMLSDRSTRQLVGPRVTQLRQPNILPAI